MTSDKAKEGQKRRAAKHRESLAERGIKPLTLVIPEIVHPPLKAAARRMKEGEDPFTALRTAAGINAPPDTVEIQTALDQAREQITDVVRQRDSERDARQKAERERDQVHGQLEDARAQVGQLKVERDGALSEVRDLTKRVRDAEGVVAKAQMSRGVLPFLARHLLGIPSPPHKPMKPKPKP